MAANSATPAVHLTSRAICTKDGGFAPKRDNR